MNNTGRYRGDGAPKFWLSWPKCTETWVKLPLNPFCPHYFGRAPPGEWQSTYFTVSVTSCMVLRQLAESLSRQICRRVKPSTPCPSGTATTDRQPRMRCHHHHHGLLLLSGCGELVALSSSSSSAKRQLGQRDDYWMVSRQAPTPGDFQDIDEHRQPDNLLSPPFHDSVSPSTDAALRTLRAFLWNIKGVGDPIFWSDCTVHFPTSQNTDARWYNF